MENNFICFTCQKKPVQFTILHCDHIICSKCLDNSLTKLKQISMVQCRCGLKTYCNEDSMRLSLRTPEMMEVKKELLNIKELQNENTRISHFLINESEISSKDNTFLRNKENINNQNQKCSFNPYSYSKCFLKTQPMNIEDSNPFFPDEKKNIGSNRKIATGVKSVQSIKSMSPSQKVSEKVSPKKIKRKQSPKNVLSLYSSNSAFSSDVLNYVAKQLQKQLKFLWIQYEKQISACQKTFKSILKSITTSYESLVSSVERFYLDQATEIDINDKDQLILGLPKVIKKKYDSSVGSKISYLNQKLLKSFEAIGPKKAFEAQRYVRETVFVAQDISKKKEKTLSKNEDQKSKSKRKIKQCALYLAISPKNKNDKIVNYIDVIKKEVRTSKNGNLVKRTKGEKIRIY